MYAKLCIWLSVSIHWRFPHVITIDKVFAIINHDPISYVIKIILTRVALRVLPTSRSRLADASNHAIYIRHVEATLHPADFQHM